MTQPTNINTDQHFGVPIYEAQVPDFESQQAALVAHFLHLRQQSGGVQISNQGGWHSSADLHHSEEPCVRWLMQHVARIGARSIKHAQTVPEDVKIMLVSAWANVNEAGDWNAPHAHFPCHWSGVCYVDISDKDHANARSQKDGDILFFDPLPLGPQYHRPPTITKQPTVGKIFIFPSYLVHMVAPHFDDRPRISLAFNFTLEAKTGPAKEN